VDVVDSYQEQKAACTITVVKINPIMHDFDEPYLEVTVS
jgi:hypothetical protein